MAVVTYALTTLADVKAQLGITDSSKDAVLEFLIDGVTDFIETFCNRRFKDEGTSYVELIDGTGGKTIAVRNYPITTFTKLELRGGDGVFDEVDTSLFYRDDKRGLLVFYNPINQFLFSGAINVASRGVANFKATYKGGFATIPNDLKMAATQMVVREYNQRQGGGDISSERIGEYSVTYRAGVDGESDKFVDQTLFRYKAPKV